MYFVGENSTKMSAFSRLPNSMTIELLTIDLFSDKVGQTFVIEESDAPAIALTLTEVTALRNYANAARAPFSLIFTTHGVGVMPQRMYTLRNAALGPQAFFLVPIGKKDDTVTYQAIFN
jgi:hypothetical protein